MLDDDELERLRVRAQSSSPEIMAYLSGLRDKEVAQLEGKADRNWNAIRHFSRRATILLLALLVAQLAQGLWSAHINSETRRLSMQNAARIRETATARRNSIILSCNEENKRHDEAKAGVIALIPPPKKKLTPAQEGAQERIINGLTDAFVPRYNCAERLRKFTAPSTGKTKAPMPAR